MTVSGAGTSARPPSQTLTFTLTRADALAYETLPREIGGWRVALLLVWIGLAGAVVSSLPQDWIGEEGGWRFWAFMAAGGFVQYMLAALAMSVHAHWRATRRLPRPVAVEMLDQVDHLEWREDGVPRFVAIETLGAVATTAAHLFVPIDGQVLIIPVRAFADQDAMMVYGAELDRRGAICAAEYESQSAE